MKTSLTNQRGDATGIILVIAALFVVALFSGIMSYNAGRDRGHADVMQHFGYKRYVQLNGPAWKHKETKVILRQDNDKIWEFKP